MMLQFACGWHDCSSTLVYRREKRGAYRLFVTFVSQSNYIVLLYCLPIRFIWFFSFKLATISHFINFLFSLPNWARLFLLVVSIIFQTRKAPFLPVPTGSRVYVVSSSLSSSRITTINTDRKEERKN